MKAVLLVLAAAGLAAVILTARRPARAEGRNAMVGNPRCGTRPGQAGPGTPLVPAAGNQLAIFGQGCFWGVEERFRKLPGVVATAVGYAGGRKDNPSYEDVCGHDTGHAEVVLVEFDPRRLPYAALLKFFWETHDPTSGDRQGPDVGDQYRSAVYTFGPEQLREAQASRAAEQARLADPITTEIRESPRFWMAEDHHQQWDEKHGTLSCPAPHRPRQGGSAPAAGH